MPFELKLAFRYLMAKKRSLARFTAAAAVVGIAAGVASLIAADALARGFAGEMRDRILENSAHILVTAADGGAIDGSDAIQARLERLDNVAGVQTGAFEHAVVSSDSATSYALLQATADTETLVGKQLAERLGVGAGAKIGVVTIDNQSPVRITVDGLLGTGMQDLDATRIRVPLQKFAALVGESRFQPRHFDIRLDDIYRSAETAAAVRREVGGAFSVVDWQEANRPLFAALTLERRVAAAIISLIVLVAALNMTTTLALLVNDRRHDIGVLRACGARARSLVAVFLIEGAMLGAVGIAAGTVAGLAACFAGNRFRLVSISAEVYSVSYVPFRTSAASVLLITTCATVIVVAAALFPALRAGRVQPVENLRAH